MACFSTTLSSSSTATTASCSSEEATNSFHNKKGNKWFKNTVNMFNICLAEKVAAEHLAVSWSIKKSARSMGNKGMSWFKLTSRHVLTHKRNGTLTVALVSRAGLTNYPKLCYVKQKCILSEFWGWRFGMQVLSRWLSLWRLSGEPSPAPSLLLGLLAALSVPRFAAAPLQPLSLSSRALPYSFCEHHPLDVGPSDPDTLTLHKGICWDPIFK